jgi:hypothetical protein
LQSARRVIGYVCLIKHRICVAVLDCVFHAVSPFAAGLPG